MPASPLDNFNSKTFAEVLHTVFKVHLESAPPLELELIEVTEQDSAPKIELFSLHFRGPSSPVLRQQIYHLEHPRLGQFDLFLVPIAGDAGGITYEAVFHRLRKNP